MLRALVGRERGCGAAGALHAGRRQLVLMVSVALVASSVCAFAPARASAAACSYGANGPLASTLCWLDMAGYDDTLARSGAGQQMSVELPGGGYTLSFTLRSRPVAGAAAHPAVDPRAVPLERRFAFGSSDFVGVAGSPALYSRSSGTVSGVDLTLSDVSVVDANGRAVSGYGFVIADAENNIATAPAEQFTWTADRPLSLVGVMNSGAGRGCANGLTGLGAMTVTCVGRGTST